MQYYTINHTAKKARKKISKTVRKKDTKKARQTYDDWREDAPAGFEYLSPRPHS